MTPLWKRIHACFSYPLTPEVFGLVAVICLGNFVLSSIHHPILFYTLLLFLILLYAVYNYSLILYTSKGQLTPPSFTNSFIKLNITEVLPLFCMFMVLISMGWWLINNHNTHFILFYMLSILLTPAIIMIYVKEKDILRALNPIAIIKIIINTAAGYFTLLGLLILMEGGLNSLFSFIDYLYFKIILSCYLGFVFFHMIGYLLYQYQLQESPINNATSEIQEAQTLIDIGELTQANTLLSTLVQQHRQNIELRSFYHSFLIIYQNTNLLSAFTDTFISDLLQENKIDKAATIYEKTRHYYPDYKIKDLQKAFMLAEAYFLTHQPQAVITLLEDLIKENPNHPSLPQAEKLLTQITTR